MTLERSHRMSGREKEGNQERMGRFMDLSFAV
jgi:hypothetical protein